MEEKSNIGWIIVAIIAIVAIVGLVLLFKASITGNEIKVVGDQYMPTAAEIGMGCEGASGEMSVEMSIRSFARSCLENGGQIIIVGEQRIGA